MLIKASQDRARDIETLQALLQHPAATADKRSRIESEIRNIRAGAKGEAEAAYEIEFHHKASKNWAVIHDLRLEWQGRVAQIDHLLINRFMDCWVCETKHYSEGFAINEHGEFTAFYGGRPKGIASPIEQNRKHIEVLRAVLGSSIVQLPTRLGIAIMPTMKSVILVSKNARIQRPKTPVDGIEAVIKSDTLRTMIEKEINDASVLATFMSATKIIGQDTLEAFARQVAKLHRPIQIDWAGKFGLGEAVKPVIVPSERMPPAASERPTDAAKGDATAEVPSSPPANASADDKLSTSKLAAKLGVRNAAEMLKRLEAAGYLAKQGEGHALTPRGIECGGVWVEKSRYGPYFLWPRELVV